MISQKCLFLLFLLLSTVQSRGHGGGGHSGGGHRGGYVGRASNYNGGVYKVVSKNQHIKYIGQTNNFERREKEHRRNSQFVVKTDIFKKIPTKPNERFEKEQKMIETCKDNGSCENNKHKGGNGRRENRIFK